MKRITRLYVCIKKCLRHQRYLNSWEKQFVINCAYTYENSESQHLDYKILFRLERNINKHLLIKKAKK